MAIKPPPIQESWKLDQAGRLSSPAWIIWLQGLVNGDEAESLFSSSLTLQSTGDYSSRKVPAAADDTENQFSMIRDESFSSRIDNSVALSIDLLQPQSSTSRIDNDLAIKLDMLAPQSMSTNTTVTNPATDTEMLCWLSF